MGSHKNKKSFLSGQSTKRGEGKELSTKKKKPVWFVYCCARPVFHGRRVAYSVGAWPFRVEHKHFRPNIYEKQIYMYGRISVRNIYSFQTGFHIKAKPVLHGGPVHCSLNMVIKG